jgi:hypothetical protein
MDQARAAQDATGKPFAAVVRQRRNAQMSRTPVIVEFGLLVPIMRHLAASGPSPAEILNAARLLEGIAE